MSTHDVGAVELDPSIRPASIYNRIFWTSYAANLALVTANAFTFRFAELVNHLGGTEEVAGVIVSCGLFATLAARLVLGQAIDRYGTRRLWYGSAVMLLCGCALTLGATRIGPQIYLARMAYAVGIAGVTTCSIVHIQRQVPADRRTEIIGSLGSSGFIGMVFGAHMGDWILKHAPAGRMPFIILFGTTTALVAAYVGMVLYLTRNDRHERPHETPAIHRLVFRYWPGNVLLVAMLMGIGFTVTTVFLTRFATSMSFHGIGLFFTGYTVSAFIFRVSGSRFNGVFSRHAMILAGLTGHALGFGLLATVTKEWQLLLPAICCGFGHALLFPAVVSIGAGYFPKEYRGTGATIVLAFPELGAMLCSRGLGKIIVEYGFAPMFLTTAGGAVVIGAIYALTAARRPDVDRFPDEAVVTRSGLAVRVCEPEELADEEVEDEVAAAPLGRN
jgi:MFS family permease